MEPWEREIRPSVPWLEEHWQLFQLFMLSVASPIPKQRLAACALSMPSRWKPVVGDEPETTPFVLQGLAIAGDGLIGGDDGG